MAKDWRDDPRFKMSEKEKRKAITSEKKEWQFFLWTLFILFKIYVIYNWINN